MERDACSHLALVPNAPGHYAYRARALDNQSSSFWNSWGSSQPVKSAVDGRYHVLATRVLNGCKFYDYTYNMDLVHVVSDTLLGPYSYVNVALGTVVINPTARLARTPFSCSRLPSRAATASTPVVG